MLRFSVGLEGKVVGGTEARRARLFRKESEVDKHVAIRDSFFDRRRQPLPRFRA
jgi:hypothetical protein